jgi:hypothetical protein
MRAWLDVLCERHPGVGWIATDSVRVEASDRGVAVEEDYAVAQ